MRLYHYTAVGLAKAIMTHDLSKGHLDTPEGGIIEGVVWFTSLPFPEGTGVPTKQRQLTESEVRKAQRVEGKKLRNTLTTDKSKIRLTVESGSLQPLRMENGLPRGLISFEKWCKLYEAPKQWVREMGLSALYDLNSLTDEERFRLAKKKGNSKESTWYLHFGPIPSSLITAVDCRVGRDYVPYSFDEHGRAELAAVGVECVSVTATLELQKILLPKHSHEIVHATVICRSPSDPVEVCIRGGGNTCIIRVGTKALVVRAGNESPYPFELIHSWIDKFKSDLESCWERARDTYHIYHPEETVE
ncbi:hypothetical protein RTH46_09045 [Pseudomonas sp. zfem004]|uniref:hypothetical protein n=1 Tax=Pseudomonas sp. zfem004 TaxID=3078199 RepID=UPI00292910DA|nr:hypothetical protein [Pseudomonas sp. zfem004]MDU9402637.1 hypothetical protein [Pseudomonas sp. zfem004]